MDKNRMELHRLAVILVHLWYLAGLTMLDERRRLRRENKRFKKICNKRSRMEKELQIMMDIIIFYSGVFQKIESWCLNTLMINIFLYPLLPMKGNDRCEYFQGSCPKLKYHTHLRELFLLWLSQENILKTRKDSNLNKQFKDLNAFSYLRHYYRHLYYSPFLCNMWIMAIRSSPTDYYFSIYTFNTLPAHVRILLQPGDIFELAHYFHYTGNGQNDEIRCIDCRYPIRNWSRNVEATTLRCPKCDFQSDHYDNINRPNQSVGGITTPKLSNSITSAEGSNSTSCGGACFDTSCSGCRESANFSTERGNSNQLFDGMNINGHDTDDNNDYDDDSQAQGDSTSSYNITISTSTNSHVESPSNNIPHTTCTTIIPRTCSLRCEGQRNETQSMERGERNETQGMERGERNETQGMERGERNETQSMERGERNETQSMERGERNETQGMERACNDLGLSPERSLQNCAGNTRQNDGRQSSGSEQEAHSASPFSLEHLGVFTLEPGCPDYSIKCSREGTFGAPWPQNLQHLIISLAVAGFFYCGYGDTVRCFYCKIELKDWNIDDDPWVEHAKCSPYCEYLRANKGDGFVCTVKNRRSGMQPYRGGQHPNTTAVREGRQTTPDCAKANTEPSETKPSRAVEDIIMEAMEVQNTAEGISPVQEQLSRPARPQHGDVICENCHERNCCTFIPCSHKVVCEECSLMFDSCPKCNKKIESVRRM